MSPGQTGHITGQMGRVPGTDGTHTRGCPAKILYVYWFFVLSHFFCLVAAELFTLSSPHCGIALANDACIMAYIAVDFCGESANRSENAWRRRADFLRMHIALHRSLV